MTPVDRVDRAENRFRWMQRLQNGVREDDVVDSVLTDASEHTDRVVQELSAALFAREEQMVGRVQHLLQEEVLARDPLERAQQQEELLSRHIDQFGQEQKDLILLVAKSEEKTAEFIARNAQMHSLMQQLIQVQKTTKDPASESVYAWGQLAVKNMEKR